MLRRSRAKTIVLCACAIGVVFFILSRILGGGDGVPSGTPPVVIVTVMDTVGYSKEYQDSVKENRIQYARKHGKHMPARMATFRYSSIAARTKLIILRIRHIFP